MNSIWSNPGNRGQRLRRTLSAVECQLWKRTFAKPRVLTLPNGRRFKRTATVSYPRALIYAEFPEYHELRIRTQELAVG